MNDIALKGVPVKLGVVKLYEGPVYGALIVAGIDGNRRGINNVSQDALALRTPGVGDVMTELEYARLECPHLFQLVHNLLLRRSCLGILTLDIIPKTHKLFLVAIGNDVSGGNFVRDGLESVLEGTATKVDNLTMRHAVVLVVVELVGILAEWENNMMSSEEEDPVAPAALAEIETARSF